MVPSFKIIIKKITTNVVEKAAAMLMLNLQEMHVQNTMGRNTHSN